MIFKIGDKVKMTPDGFRFYSNVDKIFEVHSVSRSMEHKHFTGAVCELFAVHGVGTVKRLNEEGSPYIRWEFNLNGVYYFYTNYFDTRDVKKLNLLDKLKLFLFGNL